MIERPRVIAGLRRALRKRCRDFQNDVLAALTARRHSATVVTSNQAEFELLAPELGVVVFAEKRG